MPEPKRNMGASVRARLLKLAKERNQPNDLLLTRYALERLLYRLSTTKHRERFVLKGAVLMTTWFEDPFRPTRDLDLLGYGDPDPQAMLAVFREICAAQMDDGVVFDVGGLAADLIREELEYGGLRIKTDAAVAGARVRILIDIGFGDAIEPGATELDLPVLLACGLSFAPADAVPDVRSRVHAELLRLARPDRDNPKRAIILAPPNQSELASRINTRRETVSREINAMEREGLIERRRGAIVITDALRLSARIESTAINA